MLATTLKTELGDEKFAKSEKLIKAEFEERKYNVVREYVLSEKQPHRRPRLEDDSPDHDRGRRSSRASTARRSSSAARRRPS